MPYVATAMLIVQFTQDEIMIRTRSFLILVLPVSLKMRFPRPDFHGQTPLIRTTIMDEYGVGFFLLSSVAPLAMGRPEKYDLLNVLPANWCHVSWFYWQGIMSIYLTEEHATCPLFICLCHFRCQGPLPINSWFPSLPSSFLKFPSSITLVLDSRLEVSYVHSFPLS